MPSTSAYREQTAGHGGFSTVRHEAYLRGLRQLDNFQGFSTQRTGDQTRMSEEDCPFEFGQR